MKKIVTIKNNSNQRIDKFLKEEVFFNEEITRGEIIRQIKSGNVLVNNKKIKPSYILKTEDAVEVRIKKKELGSKKNIIPNRNIKFEIIYQDKNIIVVNKPARLQVHPDFHEKKNTLANGLIYQFPEIKNVGDNPEIRPGIVHRLDKDTSGIIVIARNQKVFEKLKKKFKDRKIEKKYLAIVYGSPEDNAGTIEKPIARSSNYKKQVIAGKKTRTTIRQAVTEYKAIKRFKGYSLAEVSPKTGRTHQIRIHMASIGNPVVGDKIYKLKKIKRIEAPRQLLHAKGIKFELFGRNYKFEAPLPDDFGQFLTFDR